MVYLPRFLLLYLLYLNNWQNTSVITRQLNYLTVNTANFTSYNISGLGLQYFQKDNVLVRHPTYHTSSKESSSVLLSVFLILATNYCCTHVFPTSFNTETRERPPDLKVLYSLIFCETGLPPWQTPIFSFHLQTKSCLLLQPQFWYSNILRDPTGWGCRVSFA